MKTYEYKSQCSNCGKVVLLIITKGTTVDKYEDTHKCDNCGCRIGYGASLGK